MLGPLQCSSSFFKKLLPASSTSGFQHLSHILWTCRLLSEWLWWNYHTPAVGKKSADEWDKKEGTKAENESGTGTRVGGAAKTHRLGEGIKDAERQGGKSGGCVRKWLEKKMAQRRERRDKTASKGLRGRSRKTKQVYNTEQITREKADCSERERGLRKIGGDPCSDHFWQTGTQEA